MNISPKVTNNPNTYKSTPSKIKQNTWLKALESCSLGEEI